ncbi:hypothetical protein BH24ACT1_BH24ACT1_11630 [soil metagenome]
MNPRRLVAAPLVFCSLALAACGADQDPAIEAPDDESTTTSASAAPGGPTSAELTLGSIELTGDSEVPGPGAEDAAGQAHVYLEADGSICYDFIGIDGLDTPPTAAHIHEGDESTAGPPVLTLETPTEGSLDACAADQADLSARIAENPAGFYINVHNEEFPDGAIRGQLES